MREAATERVRQAIVEVFPTASVQVFGSFVTGVLVIFASCSAVRSISHLIVLCCACALAPFTQEAHLQHAASRESACPC